jgi:hypothetical protein
MGLYFGGGWGGWGGWGWHAGWGGHNIIVNNNFIHRYNFNARGSASLNGRSDWSHDASHRGGVPYSNAAVANRYRGAERQNLQTHGAAEQTQMRDANSNAATERMGNRDVQKSAPGASRNAFGGVRNGGAARTQSDHGFSSMGPSRSGGGGFASHGGGGGSHGGGGHGGGRR